VLLPAPVPGLVIRYSYLWHNEHLASREEGQKDRLCAIVAALRPAADPDETRVLVLPVTHSPPAQPALAVEIPAPVKERLRLDAERSWVMLSEWNEFIWPGPDVRRAPGVAMPARWLMACCRLDFSPSSVIGFSPWRRRGARAACPGRNKLGRRPAHGIIWRDASMPAFENEKLRRR
jgi:hypothetical protein